MPGRSGECTRTGESSSGSRTIGIDFCRSSISPASWHLRQVRIRSLRAMRRSCEQTLVAVPVFIWRPVDQGSECRSEQSRLFPVARDFAVLALDFNIKLFTVAKRERPAVFGESQAGRGLVALTSRPGSVSPCRRWRRLRRGGSGCSRVLSRRGPRGLRAGCGLRLPGGP